MTIWGKRSGHFLFTNWLLNLSFGVANVFFYKIRCCSHGDRLGKFSYACHTVGVWKLLRRALKLWKNSTAVLTVQIKVQFFQTIMIFLDMSNVQVAYVLDATQMKIGECFRTIHFWNLKADWISNCKILLSQKFWFQMWYTNCSHMMQ